MKKNRDLKSMSVDQLWSLFEQLVVELNNKLEAEKATLEARQQKLSFAASTGKLRRGRSPYPTVLPKYQNPENTSETWAGRGKQPRWLKEQLRSGKKLGDLLIKR
jgi:DNA-binding protein H-NS